MEIVIILGLIFFNGILSMSEIAMVSARKSRLETAAKKGSKTAKTALRLANEPDRFLSTIQIGITLIGILTGLYSGEALAGDLARWLETIGIPQAHSLTLAKGIIVILVTYLTLILGELVPKPGHECTGKTRPVDRPAHGSAVQNRLSFRLVAFSQHPSSYPAHRSSYLYRK